MKLLATVLAGLLLLAVAAFCAVGFLATFEPTDRAGQFVRFRMGYALIAIMCLMGAGVLFVNAARK